MVEAEESSLAESLFNLCLGAGLIFTKKVALAAKKAGAPKTRQVKISACSEPSRGPEGTTDVIVYPEVCAHIEESVDVLFLVWGGGWGQFRVVRRFRWCMLYCRGTAVAALVWFRSVKGRAQGCRVEDADATHPTSMTPS